jgi:hypothetical protein
MDDRRRSVAPSKVEIGTGGSSASLLVADFDGPLRPALVDDRTLWGESGRPRTASLPNALGQNDWLRRGSG